MARPKGPKVLRGDIRPDNLVKDLSDFGRFVYQHFAKDRYLQVAAALSYTTLLALVPLIAIAFSIFSAFPAFNDAKDVIKDVIFQNLAPQAGDAVSSHFETFLSNTSGLTAVGVIFLVFTAVALLNTIERTFNMIWKVQARRSLTTRFLSFWTALTLGPLLIAVSVTASNHLLEFAKDLPAILPVRDVFVFLLSVGFFMMIFMILPHTQVRLRHAAVGASVTAILFLLLKSGFGYYVHFAASYQTIYGALATIPIFLIWLFVSWSIILFGALLTASLKHYETDKPKSKVSRAK